MASQLKKTRTITDKVSVKGVLSDDGTVITYTDENKEEKEITVENCLKVFVGLPIDFSVSVKTENDLSDEDDEG